MAVATHVKTDSEPYVKADPDAATPASMADEDDYEDTGELEFSKGEIHGWLARIPKVLWDKWSSIEEDEEIQIGSIREFKNSKRYKLVLDPHAEHNAKVPKEFDMRVTDANSRNTFVFSEKDIPGYKSKLKNESKTGHEVSSGAGIDKTKRFQPYFKRSIPKQTALVATTEKEVHCIATEDQEYGTLIKQRMLAETKGRKGIEFIKDDVGKLGQTVLPSSGTGMGGFNNFVAQGLKAGRPKTQDNKTARIPQSDLLDLLYECFKEYNYWPLKALKARLRQPESYLKETLNLVATLVKSGPFAMNYKLLPENNMKVMAFNPKDDMATTEATSEDEDDGDDGDLDMEDVA